MVPGTVVQDYHPSSQKAEMERVTVGDKKFMSFHLN
jgi:hypothetical protein